MRVYVKAVSIILALILPQPIFAQEPKRARAIWQDRGDAAMLDLVSGPGSKDRGPGINLTFIKELEGGSSPKFEVQDENGIKWKVKLGPEAKSETAATRLVWAAGYFVDEDYYRPQIHVRGLQRLRRGQEFVSDGEIVTGARLERGSRSLESKQWSWYDNPFAGSREFNGLRVMMALVNNWDLKQSNNGSSVVRGGGGHYGITDLGATLGSTGNTLRRSKGVVKDYAESEFIEKVAPTYVDFVMHSRPFFFTIFNLNHYRFRTRMESIAKRIPIDDARWIGGRLGQFSIEQIGDCFRAAGFPPSDVEAYTRVVMQRIAALNRL